VSPLTYACILTKLEGRTNLIERFVRTKGILNVYNAYFKGDIEALVEKVTELKNNTSEL